jgi:hypothetical protein
MSTFGIQGPLIPGDASFSSGMVNGSVRVFGTVQSDVSKTELTVLATGLTTLTPGVINPTTTVVLNGMLDGVISVTTVSATAGSIVLPTATAILSGLAAQSFLNTVGSPLAQYPSVGDVLQFDVINTTGAALAVVAGDASVTVVTPTSVTSNTADTVKYMFTNLSTPAVQVYSV